MENTTAAPGMAGQFDVVLLNNSGSAVTIGASAWTCSSRIRQPSASRPSITTQRLLAVSNTGSFGFVSNLLPMEAAGNDIALSGGQVVNPGDTWGLAHLRYLVDPSAPPGTVVGVMLEPTPVFLPPPGGTSLSDPTGAPVQFTSVNGTITITGTAIPEPASVTLLGISGVILLVGTRLARRGNTQCRD